MSVEDRLHQIEKRLEQIEEKQDQHWESYKSILTGIMRELVKNLDMEAEK